MEITITGTVVNGNKIGRLIGFPTANIRIEDAGPEAATVTDGVYVARVLFGEREYDAMAYVGAKPTVGGAAVRTLEVYLFDFSGDLYGREITVMLRDFVRPDRRFDSFEALRRQIEADRDTILARLGRLS